MQQHDRQVPEFLKTRLVDITGWRPECRLTSSAAFDDSLVLIKALHFGCKSLMPRGYLVRAHLALSGQSLLLGQQFCRPEKRLGLINIMQASHRNRLTSIRTVVAYLMLLASVTLARADEPLVSMWVAIKVTQCKAVTFEAPANKPDQYVPGEKYRTAQVAGQVVDAGVRLSNMPVEWRQKAAEEAEKRLPVKGSELFLVMREWNAPFCEAAIGKVERFNYDYSCDFLLRTGPCMPPHQLVRPAAQ